MKILSIETTTNFGSVAFLEDGLIKREVFFESDDIAGEIVDKLDVIGNNFDYVVVSIGPGSWTGIRIGISFAKGLVCGDINKIYCVSIFDSLFYSIKDIKVKSICLVPSKKEEFYYSEFKGEFDYEKNFKINKIGAEKLIPLVKTNKYFLIGPGVLNLKEFINIERIKTIKFLWYPRASMNGFVAYEKIRRNIKSLPPEPIYEK